MKGNGLPIVVQTKLCIYCNKSSLLQMSRAEYSRFQSGLLIQQALPDWTQDKRELLISGTHQECWDKMFSEMDEDDEAV